jgi:hypothetical protein
LLLSLYFVYGKLKKQKKKKKNFYNTSQKNYTGCISTSAAIQILVFTCKMMKRRRRLELSIAVRLTSTESAIIQIFTELEILKFNYDIIYKKNTLIGFDLKVQVTCFG